MLFTVLQMAGSLSAAPSADFRLELAKKMVKEGKIDAAVKEYKKHLGENPFAPIAYLSLAKLRLQQNKFKLAVINFRTALKQNPDLIEAQEGIAVAYEKGGERETGDPQTQSKKE